MTSLLRYQAAVSLDGLIAPEDGSVQWLEKFEPGSEFDYFLSAIGGIIMGRATYDLSLTFGAWLWKQPTAVMTSRPLPESVPPDVFAVQGAPADVMAALRQKMPSGDIWLMGGGKTAAQFLDAGLIDRVELAVVPIVLGRGIPLFNGARSTQTSFTLAGSSTTASGLVNLDYRRI